MARRSLRRSLAVVMKGFKSDLLERPLTSLTLAFHHHLPINRADVAVDPDDRSRVARGLTYQCFDRMGPTRSLTASQTVASTIAVMSGKVARLMTVQPREACIKPDMRAAVAVVA